MLPKALHPAALIQVGKEVLQKERDALDLAEKKIGPTFAKAVELILACQGKVVVTGIGKSGLVGSKIASTFSSTGTPSFFLHASEALHGDFGMVDQKDCVLAIAFGGETREVLAVVKFAKEMGVSVIGLTGNLASSLAQQVDCVLDGGVPADAEALGAVPTASTTVAIAWGDALAVAVMHSRGFTKSHFAKLHPGGQLGLTLTHVVDFMRPVSELHLLEATTPFQQILHGVSSPNFGIVAIVDAAGMLLGAVSDGDLRRALLQHQEKAFQFTAAQIMNATPKQTQENTSVLEAINQMEKSKITSLFVTKASSAGRAQVIGIVRLHDLLAAKVL
jgi:arabinose-5-phosphate isomerase